MYRRQRYDTGSGDCRNYPRRYGGHGAGEGPVGLHRQAPGQPGGAGGSGHPHRRHDGQRRGGHFQTGGGGHVCRQRRGGPGGSPRPARRSPPSWRRTCPAGDTSVCAMARSAGAEVVPVDIGTAVPLTGARIVQRCVRRGTAEHDPGPRHEPGGGRAGRPDRGGDCPGAVRRGRAPAGHRGDGHRQHHHLLRRGRRAAGPGAGSDDRPGGPACPTRACRRRSTPSRPPWR